MMYSIMNLIIGKDSNLSKSLEKVLKESILISSKNLDTELSKINFKNKKINIIFNQFQTASKLNQLDSPIDYVYRSIDTTAYILEFCLKNKIKINKIIYTSSSSVYGNNVCSEEKDDLKPLNLHASLKIANEKLVQKYCADNDIDYTIARVYNMYGGDDNFSIISKILSCYKNKNTLNLVNNGKAVRDYIHVDDITNIFKKILNINNINILNIGTGYGQSVLYLLSFLEKKGYLIDTSNINREELQVSTSNNTNLLSLMGDYKFQSVENFLLKEIEKYELKK